MTRAAGLPSRLISGNTYTIRRDGRLHVISEQYGYKTEPYYAILSHELKGEEVCLSAIAPARYPALPAAERSLLRSYLSGQVFL